MADRPTGVSIKTPAGMARMNKWLAAEKKRQAAPCRWAESTLAAGSLSTDPADYIATSDGGRRQVSSGASCGSGEPPWFAAMTGPVEEAAHARGSREHLAAALLVALAFEGSFVRAGKAGEAAEAAFRVGALWEAARRDEDAALGRRVLKLRTGPAELTRANLANAVDRFARRASLAIEAEQWARTILGDAGLPTHAEYVEPDGQGGLRPTRSEWTADVRWWAPLPKAVLKLGHPLNSPVHRAAEVLWWLAGGRAAVAADNPEEAAACGFEAGVTWEAVNHDPHAAAGRHRRLYTAKGGRRKGDDEDHGRWWLVHQRLRRMFPRDRFPDASDHELARAIGEHFDADPDVVRVAVARMNAWKLKSER
jgi:hypothetical protein